MIPLTIHLMIQNNEETIKQTLESILPLQASIIVADIGCCDKTVNICKSYNLPITKVSAIPDRSKARNDMVKMSQTNWQFYIEPWEMLLSGQDCLTELVKTDNKQSYHCEILQGDTITKQVRLWDKSVVRFTNPIFETLRDENSACADIILYLEKKNTPSTEMIENWKKTNPLATEPYYFQACSCLAQKKYKEFLTLAEHYLFNERNQRVSVTMTQYYVGIVHCLVTNNLEVAIRNAIICVAANPLMAEFWCLLGDAYFQAKEFEKSIAFYENAMLLGERRLKGDRWPMHISKYDEYPKEMIESCNKIIATSNKFYIKKQDQAH